VQQQNKLLSKQETTIDMGINNIVTDGNILFFIIILLFTSIPLYFVFKYDSNEFVKIIKGKRSFKDYKLTDPDNFDEISFVVTGVFIVIFTLFMITIYFVKKY